jgi:hypothetical protein
MHGIDNWHKCYNGGWKGLIVPEAFGHPAKVAYGLAERIYQHAIKEGWLTEGSVVADPFGGIGGFALHAMLGGMSFVGVELEEKFVKLGNENIELWNSLYKGKMPKWGTAVLIQGDSRNFAEIVGKAVAMISSPPFFGVTPTRGDPKYSWKFHGDQSSYSSTPGNLGNMPACSVDSVISSPPFLATTGGCNKPINGDNAIIARHAAGNMNIGYSDNPSSLTNNPNTFWAAARTIVEQVYQVLPVGGHAIWVCKDYVKGGEIVPFCDNWRRLCEAVGFETVHEHHAMLVMDKGTQIDMNGDKIHKTIKRASFFRRLAEKRGSPAIDWEVVYCMVKGENGIPKTKTSS